MRGGPGTYARAIERCWSDAVGRPVVLSPRDWALISDWHDRRVPLAIIEEVIGQTMATRRRRGSAPRSLGYIAAAVEEAWAVVQEGRPVVAAPASTPEGRAGGALSRWRERAALEPSGSPLAKLLQELIERQAAGTAAGELDRELGERLPDAVPQELLGSTRQAVERQLAGFRERMDDDVYLATLRRAVVARLRRALELPSIAE